MTAPVDGRPETSEWQVRIPDVPTSLAVAERLAVIVGAEGTALAVDRRTGEPCGRVEVEGGLLHAAVSPAGSMAAVTGPFGAYLWEMGGASPRPLVTGAWSSVARWANEQRLAVASGRCVEVFDGEGASLWRSDTFPSTVTDLAWLGGRHRMAVASYGGVHALEARKGGASTFMPFTGSLLAICTNPNGRWIVSGNQDATLQVFRSDNDTRLEMEGYPSKITRVAFDSAGKYLANDGAPEVSVWDFSGPGPRGRAPVLLVPSDEDERADIGALAWHPGAAQLAVGWSSGACEIYRVGDGVPGRPLQPSSTVAQFATGVTCLAWAPDGETLLVAEADGTISCVQDPLP